LILFHPCAGEAVARLEMHRTDDDFEEVLGVLWSIEAEGAASTARRFTIGRSPDGFRTEVPFKELLEAEEHLQVVVTITRVGTIPMSFNLADLVETDVLVRGRHRSQAEFEKQANASCS
jgi:hypothetical protein